MNVEQLDLQQDEAFYSEAPAAEEAASAQHALEEPRGEGWSRFSTGAQAPYREWDALAGDTALGALLRVAARRGHFG